MPASAISTHPALQSAVERLCAFAPVERIILFGSRARGDGGPESDWDLCVLLSDDIPPATYTPSRLWHVVRDLGLPIQIVPMRSRVFEARRGDVNALARDVAEDGLVLFEAHRQAA